MNFYRLNFVDFASKRAEFTDRDTYNYMKYIIFMLILQSFLIIKKIFIIFNNPKTRFLWTLIASVSAGFNILYLFFTESTSSVFHGLSTRFPLFSMRFPPAFHVGGFDPAKPDVSVR